VGVGRRGSLGSRLLGPRLGAEVAFSEVYRELSPRLLRYFAGQTRDAQVAVDLTAETFAKAFEKRGDFRGSNLEQASAWVWTIARNELAGYRRSHVIELRAVARLKLERPRPSEAELREIERLIALDEAQDHMGRALALLPEDQREVVRLRFVDALSYVEIAQRLGISTDVARARASRALRTLRGSADVDRAIQSLEV
jgi:RNA polymerase sigma-70 factor, ECF subfamily